MGLYRVMLVDDEEDVRQAIARKINWEEIGFQVVASAENGQEALELAERLHPDVVMTDIKMPFMDGLTLGRALKKRLKNIKVIIFSGFDEFEYAKEAIKLEAEEYLLKPLNAEELEAVFKRIRENLDREIDQKEREIESQCLKLLLQQQPVARDLRLISAALKMITDMERIGDQAEDIAEIISFLHGHQAEDNDLLREMAKATIRMVTESVDAYVKCDTMLAEQVIAEDDTVDGYFTQVKERLIGKIAQDPADGEYALDLLMIAKYFERIGDHATNIAEWVIFSVTGVHKGE